MDISHVNLSSDKDYLQFSKRKTTEFKAQHPQKTAAQIDRMVEKQWSNAQKQTQSRSQKSSPSRKSKSTGQKNIREVKEEGDFHDPVKRIEFQSEQKPMKTLQKIEEKMPSLDEQIKEASESINSVATKIRQSRKIQKKQKTQKRETQYIKFYRHYFQKLHLEHPKWSNVQITQIVKLLWRRKKSVETKRVKTLAIPFKSIKPMEGKTTFARMMKSRGASKEEVRASWKQLPRQSRNYWKSKGWMTCGFSRVKRTPQNRIMVSMRSKFATAVSKPTWDGPLGFLQRAI